MRRTCLLLLCAVIATEPLVAQVSDDFSDGDFLHNPRWQGTGAHWQIVPFGDGLMLNTNGPARSDTLYLSTESAVAYGSWRFRFAYQDVNLSNFNGTRIFLVADTAQLTADVRGYFLQFGTNNSNQLRLYRIDGDPSQGRVELGRSSGQVLAATSGDFTVEVRRTAQHDWEVRLDGELLISARDSLYQSASAFGFWVKHTASAADRYYFGEIEVRQGEVPAVDPLRVSNIDVYSGTQIGVAFSRPVRADGACLPEVYTIMDGPPITAVECDRDDVLQHLALRLSASLSPGDHVLMAGSLTDEVGRVHDPIEVRFTATEAEVRPFEILDVVHQMRAPDRLLLVMSRPVDTAELEEPVFTLEGVGAPAAVHPHAKTDALELVFDADISPGVHELGVMGLRAANGDVFSGSYLVEIDAPPDRSDVVINEIHFDPPDQLLEFIELYNRSQREIDLSQLDFADDRMVRSPVTDSESILPPGDYAVLVRDSAVFLSYFPDVPYIVPPVWHTLNNAGDAVVIFAGRTTVDSVRYAGSWIRDNRSAERIDHDGPALAFNFASSEAPEGATPGHRNSVFSTDRNPVSISFAEEAAPGTIHIGYSGHLRDEPYDPAAFRIDGRPAYGAWHHATGIIALRHDGDRPRTLSIRGLIDGYGDAVPDTTLEIVLLPRPGEIVINEIMYAPLADPNDGLPDQPEYIELLNLTDHRLTLSRVAIADAPDENGNARLIEPLRLHQSLAGSGMAVISAEPLSNAGGQTESRLAAAFPEIDINDREVVLLPVRRATLSLSRGGRLLRLVSIPDLDSTGLSDLDAVHYHPSWHHPAVRDPNGRSLERIDATRDAGDAFNWSTSVAPAGGTPGRANSVSRDDEAHAGSPGIVITPSTFSPDDDGLDDLAHIAYQLRAASAVVRVRIFDSRGRLVRQLEPASFEGANGVLTWDGFDDDGRRLPIGIYIVLLDATDVQNGTVESYRDIVVLARRLG